MAFSSAASNLVAGNANSLPDTFVRDRVLGADDAVRIHDRFTAATLTPVGWASWTAAAISSNGRYVAVFDEATGKIVVTANTL